MMSDRPDRNSNQKWLRLALLLSIIVLAVVCRVLPHPRNFTPVGALALFGGATFASRSASVLVPLGALFIGDMFLGLHSLMPFVYGCLLFNVSLGWWLRERRRPLPIAGATLLGAIVFFLVTNLGVWWAFYEHSLAGLIACYVAAIPYFGRTLLGDFVFATAFFGCLALAEEAFPVLRPGHRPVAA